MVVEVDGHTALRVPCAVRENVRTAKRLYLWIHQTILQSKRRSPHIHPHAYLFTVTRYCDALGLPGIREAGRRAFPRYPVQYPGYELPSALFRRNLLLRVSVNKK